MSVGVCALPPKHFALGASRFAIIHVRSCFSFSCPDADVPNTSSAPVTRSRSLRAPQQQRPQPDQAVQAAHAAPAPPAVAAPVADGDANAQPAARRTRQRAAAKHTSPRRSTRLAPSNRRCRTSAGHQRAPAKPKRAARAAAPRRAHSAARAAQRAVVNEARPSALIPESEITRKKADWYDQLESLGVLDLLRKTLEDTLLAQKNR